MLSVIRDCIARSAAFDSNRSICRPLGGGQMYGIIRVDGEFRPRCDLAVLVLTLEFPLLRFKRHLQFQ